MIMILLWYKQWIPQRFYLWSVIRHLSTIPEQQDTILPSRNKSLNQSIFNWSRRWSIYRQNVQQDIGKFKGPVTPILFSYHNNTTHGGDNIVSMYSKQFYVQITLWKRACWNTGTSFQLQNNFMFQDPAWGQYRYYLCSCEPSNRQYILGPIHRCFAKNAVFFPPTAVQVRIYPPDNSLTVKLS